MSAPTANARPASAPVGYTLGVITVVLLFAGLAFAYGLDAAGHTARVPAHRSDTTILTRTIGGRELTIPRSWFRYAEQEATGFAKQIDLHFMLPLGPGGAQRGIDVTLLPRSAVRPSARLLDAVYLHLFEAKELSGGPAGLIGKPLRAVEGYASEEVWYDPISSEPFVAKCGAPIRAGAESRCLRSVYLGSGIAAVYSFDRDVLEEWRAFDPAVGEVLKRIGVSSG